MKYRIVKDIDGGEFKTGDYHKGRYYIILYETNPFGEDAKVVEIGNFYSMCKSFQEKVKELGLKELGLEDYGEEHE